MKFALNIQPAVTQQAGIGRYTRELATNLASLTTEDESLRLDYFDFKRQASIAKSLNENAALNPVRWIPGSIIQKSWNHLGFPPYEWLYGNADLFHFTNFVAPPTKKGKTLVSIHDLSFMRYPQYTEPKNLKHLSTQIHRTAARADGIITISEFSATEIETFLHVPREKIFPIHLGVAPEFTRPSEKAIAQFCTRQALSKPYLLTVGTIEPRKNIPFLVDLFENMHEYEGDLIIAGGLGWRYESILSRIEESSQKARIRRIGYMPDNELPFLYAAADAFILPSFYEGFGLPPLEAMACETPVVASSGGSLKEVLGDGAIVNEHYDTQIWKSSILSLLHDESKKNALIEKGKSQSKKYSWSQTASRTMNVYRKQLS